MKYGMSDTKMRFTRAGSKGYSAREVDEALEELSERVEMLTRENEELKEENERFLETLESCNEKLREFSENTNQMESEREREKLRIANILTSAEKTAEQTLTEAEWEAQAILGKAGRKAEELLREAHSTSDAYKQQAEEMFGRSCMELGRLMEVMERAQSSSSRHYEKIIEQLKSADDMLKMRGEPEEEEEFEVRESVPERSIEKESKRYACREPKRAIPEREAEAGKPERSEGENDIYTAYLETKKKQLRFKLLELEKK